MERRYSEELQQMWADAKRDGVVTPEEAAAIQTRMALEDEQRNAPPPPPSAWEQALPLLTIAGGTAAAGGIGKWLVEQATAEGVKDIAQQATTQAGQQLASQAGTQAASAATAGSAGQAPAMPALVSALQGGAPTAAAPSAFGGGTGLLSAGWAAPAAAVGAYYAPSAIEHGGEVLGAIADGDLSQVDTDSGVKAGLLAGGPLTAWAVPIADALGISINSGKDRDQQVRDNLRGHLQDIGFLDENWNADIGDGRFYNFGSEELRAGHTDPTQVGEEITGTPQDQSFNIDWKSYAQNPQNESVLGGMNALMMALSGGQTDRWQDLTGNAYNAAIHGGNDAEATVDQFYQSADEKGFGWGQQKESIRQAWADGRITAPERDAAFAEIDKRYGVVNETGARWDQQTLMSEEERRRNEEELAMGYIPR